VTHSTMGDTTPNSDKPGGIWLVTCSCGWKKSGTYARTNTIAEAVALRLANAYGQDHEKNPEKDIDHEESSRKDHKDEDQ